MLGPRAMAAIFCLAAVAAAAGCGGDDGRDTALDEAEAAGARFFLVYFDQHQRGRLSPAGRAVLRDTTTDSVSAELQRTQPTYKPSQVPAPCDKPRLTSSPLASGVLVEAIVDCGGEVGLGLLFVKTAGRWRVTSLRDARFDGQGRCIGKTCE